MLDNMQKVDYKNKVVLITGAAQGLGFEYAKAFAKEGAIVIMQDSGADKNGIIENSNKLQQAIENLKEFSLSVIGKNDDISTQASCDFLINDIIHQYHRIDVIVHNAGWVGYEPLEIWQEQTFDRMMSITVKSALWLIQSAWHSMKIQKHGRIILTTSDRAIYQQYSQQGLISYAAAKMAVLGIMNILADEGREYNIMVNALSPVAKTRMWGITQQPDELQPELIAPGVLYLGSSLCKSSGWVLRASNGQFHATKLVEALEVDYPRDLCAIKASTAQEVAAKWSEIALEICEPR